jgi:hypothetical protein
VVRQNGTHILPLAILSTQFHIGTDRVMTPQLSPAQRRHLERYAQAEVEGFKNTKSEHRLLALGLIERCDEMVRYTETVTWTIYKARITLAGRQFLTME